MKIIKEITNEITNLHVKAINSNMNMYILSPGQSMDFDGAVSVVIINGKCQCYLTDRKIDDKLPSPLECGHIVTIDELDYRILKNPFTTDVVLLCGTSKAVTFKENKMTVEETIPSFDDINVV